ncbi:lysylphosphatidylglycerol synthase domain-containing protein [Ramlibacter sp. PS4R-6]|uniref:lysylphosphatidylglycerol synthase domain-containing protein n=1 Tax=Ramlibacter sp. PS4R-6 TaxID=3133438 RepID=UPI0030985F85
MPRSALARPRARGTRHPAGHPQHWRSQEWWTWVKRGLSIAFFGAVLWLLVRYARNLDWQEVWDSVTEIPVSTLALAIGLAALSHLLYSCFDLIGRKYTGHTLPVPTVMAVNFVSYAFNLCIGSIVGGVGFRYRLYSRLGLKNGVITRIVSMSMLTNWLGYKLLAGVLFIVHPLVLPPSWHMGNHGMQWVGALLVAISVAYLAACVYYGDHSWDWRGHEIYLPPWRLAVLQYVISCVNWCLMAGVIYVLLGQRLHYADVLTVLLIGAIAGVIAHVPAGLGVFEFVFVALLSHIVSEGRLIGALLGYRAIYYMLPLAIALVMYLVMEYRSKHHRRALRLREGEV